MLNHKNKNNRNQLYLIPCGSLLYRHDYPSPIGGRGGGEEGGKERDKEGGGGSKR